MVAPLAAAAASAGGRVIAAQGARSAATTLGAQAVKTQGTKSIGAAVSRGRVLPSKKLPTITGEQVRINGAPNINTAQNAARIDRLYQNLGELPVRAGDFLPANNNDFFQQEESYQISEEDQRDMLARAEQIARAQAAQQYQSFEKQAKEQVQKEIAKGVKTWAKKIIFKIAGPGSVVEWEGLLLWVWTTIGFLISMFQIAKLGFRTKEYPDFLPRPFNLVEPDRVDLSNPVDYITILHGGVGIFVLAIIFGVVCLIIAIIAAIATGAFSLGSFVGDAISSGIGI